MASLKAGHSKGFGDAAHSFCVLGGAEVSEFGEELPGVLGFFFELPQVVIVGFANDEEAEVGDFAVNGADAGGVFGLLFSRYSQDRAYF